MGDSFADDRLVREEMIRDYLLRKLDREATEALESLYLSSDECFEELETGRLLMLGLGQARVEAQRLEDVTVLRFTGPASLIRQSQEMYELFDGVRQQSDTKVLIDLSSVSRIDSSGLGLLMSCYSHAVKNHGVLKLINPNVEFRNLLRLTRIDSVLECYDNEGAALQSFTQS
jgi:anti-sigma B factor antagonist